MSAFIFPEMEAAPEPIRAELADTVNDLDTLLLDMRHDRRCVALRKGGVCSCRVARLERLVNFLRDGGLR